MNQKIIISESEIDRLITEAINEVNYTPQQMAFMAGRANALGHGQTVNKFNPNMSAARQQAYIERKRRQAQLFANMAAQGGYGTQNQQMTNQVAMNNGSGNIQIQANGSTAVGGQRFNVTNKNGYQIGDRELSNMRYNGQVDSRQAYNLDQNANGLNQIYRQGELSAGQNQTTQQAQQTYAGVNNRTMAESKKENKKRVSD